MDRIHRIGQYRPIVITRLIIENSIESRILQLQEKKQAMVDSTIGKVSCLFFISFFYPIMSEGSSMPLSLLFFSFCVLLRCNYQIIAHHFSRFSLFWCGMCSQMVLLY